VCVCVFIRQLGTRGALWRETSLLVFVSEVVNNKTSLGGECCGMVIKIVN